MLKNENEQPDSKRSKHNLDNFQEQLSTIETFQDFKEACVIALQKDFENMDVKINPPLSSGFKTDPTARKLLSRLQEFGDYDPVCTIGDGNCLPRAASFFLSHDQERHLEIR